MPDVLVRNLSEATLAGLKERARRHRRSLQQEVLCILEAASAEGAATPAELAATIRKRLARGGRRYTDSTALVREDRER